MMPTTPAGRRSAASNRPEAERSAGMAFGDVVHRICELRPPEARRENVVEEPLTTEDSPGT
jgi:hypothetical protein